MNNSQSLSKKILNLIKKSRLSFFIITIACGLVYAIFILNGIIQKVTDYEAPSSSHKVVIDNQTIVDLEKIKNSNDNSDYNNLPSTRLNPFAE